MIAEARERVKLHELLTIKVTHTVYALHNDLHSRRCTRPRRLSSQTEIARVNGQRFDASVISGIQKNATAAIGALLSGPSVLRQAF